VINEERYMADKLKIMGPVLIVLILILSLAGCVSTPQPATSSASASPTASPAAGRPGGSPGGAPGGATTSQPAIVIPASQINSVRGEGAVTVSKYANLNFGSAGKIAAIYVKQGDKVAAGTILAKLDTTSLEATLAQNKNALSQAKSTQAQAAYNLQVAQLNLDKVRAVSDIKDDITYYQQLIAAAKVELSIAEVKNDSRGITDLKQAMKLYTEQIDKKFLLLDGLLSTTEYSGSNALSYDALGQTYDRLTVADARSKVLALESAQMTVNQAQDALDLAQKNLNVAQQQLEDATIKAPFSGMIAAVNQDTGNTVSAPAQLSKPIIYLIDASTFEIDVMVNELDVPKISLNQKAAVKINALPEAKIEGKVAEISSMPTIQGGIVDYTVTISFSVPANVPVKIGMNGVATISIQ
jgi:HlyD family secretion protein